LLLDQLRLARNNMQKMIHLLKLGGGAMEVCRTRYHLQQP
jgi:hypothetical protein